MHRLTRNEIRLPFSFQSGATGQEGGVSLIIITRAAVAQALCLTYGFKAFARPPTIPLLTRSGRAAHGPAVWAPPCCAVPVELCVCVRVSLFSSLSSLTSLLRECVLSVVSLCVL